MINGSTGARITEATLSLSEGAIFIPGDRPLIRLSMLILDMADIVFYQAKPSPDVEDVYS
jgi:hypothetical protein